MSAKYKSPSFLLPNELNTNTNPLNTDGNPATGTGINSLYSMNFDGVDGILDLGSEVLFDSTKGFSFSAWCKLNDYSPQYPAIIKLKTDQINYFIIFLSQTPQYTGVNIGSPSGFMRAKTEGDISGDFINTWKHVCVTFDGVNRNNSSSYKIFVDGSSINLTTANNFASGNNENTLGFGANTLAYFDGKIDEVAIFDEALTPDQIKFDLYEATTTGKTADIANNPNLPTPLAWYRMGD